MTGPVATPPGGSSPRSIRPKTASSDSSRTFPSARFCQARSHRSCSACRAGAGSPVTTRVKLTPVSGKSANENPPKTFTANTPGTVRSISRARASSDRIGSNAVPVPVGGHITAG